MLNPGARRVDAGLIALALGLGGLFLWDRIFTERPGPAAVLVDAALGVLAAAALLLRRRWPIAVAVVLIPSILVSSVALGPTMVAMSAVALYRSRRATLAVVGAHVTFLTLIFSLVGDRFLEGLIALAALDAVMVASGWLVRAERQRHQIAQREAKIAQREAKAAALARAEEARHAERERIAREMHDVLAHRLSLLVVYAGALQVRSSAPQEERDAAGVIRQGAYAALEDLREVIWMLRDPGAGETDRPQPTLTDLPVLIEQSRQAGAEVGFDNGIADPQAVAPNAGRHLYRVVQEGLTNARKHAPGSPVSVRLAGDDRGLSVEIINSLGTPTAMPGAGAGLVGLRERMTLAGGRLEFSHVPGERFHLRAWIPSQP